jgi:hypothetical protein
MRPKEIPHRRPECGMKPSKRFDFRRLEIKWCPGKDWG